MTIRLGYTIFTVANVEQTLDFFQNAFGLERKMLTPERDYGELHTGPTTLAFVSNELAHSNLDQAGGFLELDASTPAIAASITLVTEDVAGAVKSAVAAGAVLSVAPVDKPWGQTVAYLRDPSGISVELATPITL